MNRAEKIEALERSLSVTKNALELLSGELENLKQEPEQPEFEYLSESFGGFSVMGDAGIYEGAISCPYSKAGNYFQKKSHAEAKAAHMEKWGKLQQLIIEFNAEHCNGWVADWRNETQRKSDLYFNHAEIMWCASENNGCETVGAVCFDNSHENELLAIVNKHFPPEEWAKK